MKLLTLMLATATALAAAAPAAASIPGDTRSGVGVRLTLERPVVPTDAHRRAARGSTPLRPRARHTLDVMPYVAHLRELERSCPGSAVGGGPRTSCELWGLG